MIGSVFYHPTHLTFNLPPPTCISLVELRKEFVPFKLMNIKCLCLSGIFAFHIVYNRISTTTPKLISLYRDLEA